MTAQDTVSLPVEDARRLDDYLAQLEDIFDNIEGMLACKDLDTLERQAARVYGFLLKMAVAAVDAVAGEMRERNAVDEALPKRAAFFERRGLSQEIREVALNELWEHDPLGEEVREPWVGILERFEQEGFQPVVVSARRWLPRSVREGDLALEVEDLFHSIQKLAVVPVVLRGHRPDDPARLNRERLYGLELLYLSEESLANEKALHIGLRRLQKVAEVAVTHRVAMQELLKKMATFRHQTKGKSLEIQGTSLAVQSVRQRVEELAAQTETRVRIEGPMGAGKKHVAELLHRLGPGSSNPFVAVDCARVSLGRDPHHPADYAFRKRLFGDIHAEDLEEAMGAFEQARGGTLFLDSVDHIPASFQYKLAQVLQEGRFSRIGEDGHVKVDCTVILASELDLEEASGERKFSTKLLRPFKKAPRVRVPGLNERREDIPALAETFFAKQVRSQKKYRLTRMAPETLKMLTEWDWSAGNVKALQNLIGWAVARAGPEDALLEPRHLPEDLGPRDE